MRDIEGQCTAIEAAPAPAAQHSALVAAVAVMILLAYVAIRTRRS